MSRVGNKPITVPEKVTVKIDGGKVTVEGPKGTLELALPEGVSIEQQDEQLIVSRASELRRHREGNVVSGVVGARTK